jgi:Spy/CpxP family protein refolding chaperone
MRNLTVTVTAAALALGAMAVAAQAQTQPANAAGFHAQLQNATPIHQAACRGWGPYCPPGYVRACGPFRCWCRPCW